MADASALIGQSPPVDTSKPYDASTLAGKTVLITGGANGLGALMARAWAAHGAHLVIGDVDDRGGESLVAELRTRHPGSTFSYRRCDVTDWEQQVALFDEALRVSPSGGVDVVVPNAGVIGPGEAQRFENPSPDADGRLPKPDTATLAVNVVGAAYTTHLALHHLPRSRAGALGADRCILLVGSLASVVPLPGQVQYTMSKHAVAGMFRSLRATAFARGVRVNMVAPYYVGGSRMLPAAAEAVLLGGSAGSCSPEDVVDAATRLVADEAVAGRSLIVGPRTTGVDGGDFKSAVWELYAHDYDETEIFTYRYVRILNAVARARWYGAWVYDTFKIMLRGWR